MIRDDLLLKRETKFALTLAIYEHEKKEIIHSLRDMSIEVFLRDWCYATIDTEVELRAKVATELLARNIVPRKNMYNLAMTLDAFKEIDHEKIKKGLLRVKFMTGEELERLYNGFDSFIWHLDHITDGWFFEDKYPRVRLKRRAQ